MPKYKTQQVTVLNGVVKTDKIDNRYNKLEGIYLVNATDSNIILDATVNLTVDNEQLLSTFPVCELQTSAAVAPDERFATMLFPSKENVKSKDFSIEIKQATTTKNFYAFLKLAE